MHSIHLTGRLNPYPHCNCLPSLDLSTLRRHTESTAFSSSASALMMISSLMGLLEGSFAPRTLNPPKFGEATAPLPLFGQSRDLKALKSQSGASVKPLMQGNSVSCGQTSVAMAVNSLTGQHLTDRDIARKHGFNLLGALNAESRGSGYSWKDGGDFNPKQWPLLQRKLNQEKTPVLIGLNGPNFSKSGRGHIVTLLSINGDQVRYADPADGTVKRTSRQAIEAAPAHPDGKFIFYAQK